MSISSARWAAQGATDDKSTLVQPMTWCRQATSQYLNQCWLMIKIHVDLWCFLWCDPEQIVEQTIDIPVIWDTMTLAWRHTNYTSTVYWCMASNLASMSWYANLQIHNSSSGFAPAFYVKTLQDTFGMRATWITPSRKTTATSSFLWNSRDRTRYLWVVRTETKICNA